MPQIKHPIFTRYWKLLLPLTVLFIIWLLFALTSKTIPNSINYKILNQDLALVPAEPIAFKEQVEPILQRRCVVCHGCYDAPCQLKLSSIEGLQRGANEERIYEPKRIGTMEPTRLFIDEKTTAEWRLRDFFSVLNEGEQTPYNNLENSVLYRLLNLKNNTLKPPKACYPTILRWSWIVNKAAQHWTPLIITHKKIRNGACLMPCQTFPTKNIKHWSHGWLKALRLRHHHRLLLPYCHRLNSGRTFSINPITSNSWSAVIFMNTCFMLTFILKTPQIESFTV